MTEENDPENTPGDGDGFRPITSQEHLSRIIGGRIADVKRQYADYDDLKAKAQQAETAIQSLTERATAAESKVAEFETAKERAGWAQEVAAVAGVPVSALRGNTREELESHAQEIKALLTPSTPPRSRTPVPPGRGDQGAGGSRAAAAVRTLRAQSG